MQLNSTKVPDDLASAVEVLRRYLSPGVVAGFVDGELHQTPDANTPEKKMWLIVRTDIDMPVEKAMPQAGHGYLTSWVRGLLANPQVALAYLNEAQAKISVRVKSEAQLLKMYALCEEAGLPCILIKDAARTYFPEPTYTVACVGPCLITDLPVKVAKLRLLGESASKDAGPIDIEKV
jgi:peptidyl-tRNA hydrolase, PTH2 family